MPDQKISQLASGTNAQTGDLFVIARSGANYSLTTAQLFNAPSATATLAALTVDTDTLFVDAVNNRVGIGTASPTAGFALDVSSGAADTAVRIARAAAGATSTLFLGDGSVNNQYSIRAGGSLLFRVATSTLATLDSAGNLGLGVTPSAWAVPSLQVSQQQVFSQLGYTRNAVWNGSQFDYQTTAAALRYELTSAGQHRWYNAPSGTAGGAVTFTQAMTLDASGNLLVGTTSANFSNAGRGLFVINGSSNSLLSMENGGTTALYLYSNGDNSDVWNARNGFLRFGTNNTERARIDAAGNLGLGVTPNTTTVQSFQSSWGHFLGNLQINVAQNAYFDSTFKYFNSSAASLYFQDDGYHSWQTAPSGGVAGGTITFAERMRLDINGNLGLSVTPSSWGGGFRALNIVGYSFLAANGSLNTQYGTNARFDGTNWFYEISGFATRYEQLSGVHSWHIAPSGTAGNAISFTQAMTLNANGNLMLGTTTATGLFNAVGSSNGPVTLAYLSNTNTGASATARLRFDSQGGGAHIELQRTGGALVFNVNSADRWQISNSGHLLAGADNSYDIGASGATRPRNVYVATELVSDKVTAGATGSSFGLNILRASGANRDLLQAGISGTSNGLTVKWDHASSKLHVAIANIPTSSAGLPAGTLYSDSGTIKIA